MTSPRSSLPGVPTPNDAETTEAVRWDRRGPYLPTIADFSAHFDVIMDACEHLWITFPACRKDVAAFWQALHLFHNHDQEDEDEHCDPSCGAWYQGAYCSACEKRHRKIVKVATDV